MDAKQVVNGWLSGINPSDPGMVLNQYGQCQLVSKGGADNCIVLVPTSTSAEFFLFQDIAPLPASSDAKVYQELLKLNALSDTPRGGTLGFDAQTRNVVFSMGREIAITDFKKFCAILENFMNAAKEISKHVNALLGTTAEKPRVRDTARTALLNRVSASLSTKI